MHLTRKAISIQPYKHSNKLKCFYLTHLFYNHETFPVGKCSKISKHLELYMFRSQWWYFASFQNCLNLEITVLSVWHVAQALKQQNNLRLYHQHVWLYYARFLKYYLFYIRCIWTHIIRKLTSTFVYFWVPFDCGFGLCILPWMLFLASISYFSIMISDLNKNESSLDSFGCYSVLFYELQGIFLSYLVRTT